MKKIRPVNAVLSTQSVHSKNNTKPFNTCCGQHAISECYSRWHAHVSINSCAVNSQPLLWTGMSIGTNYTTTINKATVLRYLPNCNPVQECDLNCRGVPITLPLYPDCKTIGTNGSQTQQSTRKHIINVVTVYMTARSIFKISNALGWVHNDVNSEIKYCGYITKLYTKCDT